MTGVRFHPPAGGTGGVVAFGSAAGYTPVIPAACSRPHVSPNSLTALAAAHDRSAGLPVRGPAAVPGLTSQDRADTNARGRSPIVIDDTLARLASLSAAADGGWVCRGRLEHLDWRPLVEARLAEQAPALGHVRLTPLGWARAYANAARTPYNSRGETHRMTRRHAEWSVDGAVSAT